MTVTWLLATLWLGLALAATMIAIVPVADDAFCQAKKAFDFGMEMAVKYAAALQGGRGPLLTEAIGKEGERGLPCGFNSTPMVPMP